MQLKWEDLPQISAFESVATEAGGYNRDPTFISNVVENPPVNPVVGDGRTAADVQRELRVHQSRVRSAAANTRYPA
eukprot:2496116-Pleurochrysis_carterae.AAC.1